MCVSSLKTPEVFFCRHFPSLITNTGANTSDYAPSQFLTDLFVSSSPSRKKKLVSRRGLAQDPPPTPFPPLDPPRSPFARGVCHKVCQLSLAPCKVRKCGRNTVPHFRAALPTCVCGCYGGAEKIMAFINGVCSHSVVTMWLHHLAQFSTDDAAPGAPESKCYK